MASMRQLLIFLMAMQTAAGQEFRMFVIDDKQGKIFALNSTGDVIETYAIPGTGVGIAVDPYWHPVLNPTPSIVFSTIQTNNTNIYRMDMDGSTPEYIYSPLEFGAFAERLAIDPETRNLYFTGVYVFDSAGYSFISILAPHGPHIPIITQQNAPRDIVLYPSKGLLFWTDHHASGAHISTADLAGTNVKKIVSTNLTWPNGLAIDYNDDMIYWTDSLSYNGSHVNSRIERCNLSGQSREVVLEVPDTHLIDLLIDGGYLYYCSWTNSDIIRVNLKDISDQIVFASVSGATRINTMAVYSADVVNQKGFGVCSPRYGLGGCSDACIPAHEKAYYCRCDYDDSLLANGRTCKNAILCPGVIHNGQLSPSCYRHNYELCNFTCDTGYKSSIDFIQCFERDWNNADPCLATTDCGNLTAPVHGSVIYSNGTTYLSTGIFRCNTGYSLVGDLTRTCQANQTWSNNDPDCVLNDCGNLTAPVHGSVTYSNGTTYLSVWTFMCNTGYTLIGDLTRTCQANKTWSNDNPDCVINECGNMTVPIHGSVTYSNGIRYLSVGTFSCNTGYSLVGDETRTCQANKTWSNSNPDCVINECGNLTAPVHGSVTYINGTTYMSVGTFSCKTGYSLVGNSTRICQANTTWSNSDPDCVINDCGKLTAPNHGSLTYPNGTTYQSVVIFSCNTGFELTGDRARTCQANKSWSGGFPGCLKTDCGAGTFLDIFSMRCIPCPRGAYQPEANKDKCISCQFGYTTMMTGRKTEEQCVPDCEEGHGLKYGQTVSCEPCGKGQFNDKQGGNPNRCKRCPEGLTTLSIGQSTCTLFDPVSDSPVITVKFRLKYLIETDCSQESLPIIRLEIQNTIRNAFTAFIEQFSGICGAGKDTCEAVVAVIESCGTSRKREIRNSVVVNVSIPNITDTVQDKQDNNTSLATVDVLTGLLMENPETFSSQDGAIQFVEVEEQPRVTYITCNPGYEVDNEACIPCAAGTYWKQKNESCVPCPVDTYQDQLAQTKCDKCPANLISDEVGANSSTTCRRFCDINPDYCRGHGICRETDNRSAICVCDSGYEGSNCENDTDECATNNGGCVQVCKNFDGGFSCLCFDGFEEESQNSSKCRVSLFNFGEAAHDHLIMDKDDFCHGPLYSPVDIILYGTRHEKIYICSNGLISLDEPYLSYWPTGNVEDISDRTILAPYFANMDFRGHNGAIYFHTYERSDNPLFTANTNVRQAKLYIEHIIERRNFEIHFLLVVTWYQARQFPYDYEWYEEIKTEDYSSYFWDDWIYWDNESKPENIHRNVTVQLILATDGTDTYLMYIYGDQKLNWFKRSEFEKPKILIGFSVKGGHFNKLNPYSFTNLALQMDRYADTKGVNGILMYHMRQPGLRRRLPDPGTVCLDWYNIFKDQKHDVLNLLDFLACPCNKAILESWFWLRFWDGPSAPAPDAATECYDSIESRRNFTNAIRCCYDKESGGWVSDDPRAGGLLFYNRITYPTLHQTYDENMKRDCCNRSNNCNKYRELRPIGTCFVSFPLRLAIFFGDPHIVTLDGKKYTFNGWGEYLLLGIETETVSFTLQGRTARAVTTNGTVTDATIFSAFAARDSANATLQVELKENKQGLVIYGNGIDLTNSYKNKSANFTFSDGNLVLFRLNGSLNALFVETEIQLRITIGVEMLTQEVMIPQQFKNLTKGILGNFDDDETNDFIYRNGSKISGNSSERAIFPCAQSWMTSPSSSIFVYMDELGHANYSHPEFTPKFLDEADPEKVTNAIKICGEDNLECIFDLVFTGSETVAENTKLSDEHHKEAVIDASNDAPSLRGDKRVELTYGEDFYIPVVGIDENEVTFSVSGGFGATLTNVTNNTAMVYVNPNSTDPDQISVVATDARGKTSAPLAFEMVLCTGCNQNGICDFKQYRDGTKQTDAVKYAKCLCDGGEYPYWSGHDCETDFDACLYRPCAIGQDCIDFNVTFHKLNGNAYECTQCPEGFVELDNKCQDINECDSGNGGCDQICINTDGSYECVCRRGYRQSAYNKSICDDLNECDEALHDCQHICTNGDGFYNCSCYTGYTLLNSFACIAVEDVCKDVGLNCSETAGCHMEAGVAQCFCNTGYELTDDRLRCRNINECSGNVCSQTCIDTEGSFKCSCLPGFMLQADGTSCSECDVTRWGDNCANICQCGSGAARCDRVRGCICEAGWTGTTCDDDVDECSAESPCGDINQICTNNAGSFDCTCRKGFQFNEDDICEDINECDDPALNECQHTCFNVVGSFTCGCDGGYISDPVNPLKCIDLDECETGNAECQQICTNVRGRYNCYCHYGYILNDDRKTCRKVEDLCAVYGHLNCSHICVVEDQQTRCECLAGFHIGVDNQTCIDINECDEPFLNQCSQKETCRNYQGGYECSCRKGFRLENDARTCIACDEFHYGYNCANTCNCEVGAEYCNPITGCVCKPGWGGQHCGDDKNECDSVTNLCSEENMVCVNTAGSYTCICKSGFVLSESGRCEDINECDSTTLNTCQQNCLNTMGSFTCSCANGFILRDNTCIDIDECQGFNGCQHQCSNNIGGYRCKCDIGFRLDLSDRRSCIAEFECTDANRTFCLAKNADCVFHNDVSVCICRKGYEKDVSGMCKDIKECELKLCSHFCTEQDGGYFCHCPKGFSIAADAKTCFPCAKGTWGDECSETCSCDLDRTLECNSTTGICTCKTGWDGQHCTEDIDECSTGDFLCPDHSECTNINGSFICTCHTGYTKSSTGVCIQCVNGRWGDNCLNNCTCISENTDICEPATGDCDCIKGWSGRICDADVNECKTRTHDCDYTMEFCENTFGSFICHCKDGYRRHAMTGCQDIDECSEGNANCPYGCQNQPGGYTCTCLRGYRGAFDNCEECTDNTFGDNCSHPCDCIATNSETPKQSCHQVTGKCLCSLAWTGSKCDIDVDECALNAHNCTVTSDAMCQNKPGSFECVCKEGFTLGAENSCIEDAEDNFAMIIGLGIGIPVGVLALIVTIVLLIFLKMRRRSATLKSVRRRVSSTEERNKGYFHFRKSKRLQSKSKDYSSKPPDSETSLSSSQGSASTSERWMERSLSQGEVFEIKRPKVRGFVNPLMKGAMRRSSNIV